MTRCSSRFSLPNYHYQLEWSVDDNLSDSPHLYMTWNVERSSIKLSQHASFPPWAWHQRKIAVMLICLLTLIMLWSFVDVIVCVMCVHVCAVPAQVFWGPLTEFHLAPVPLYLICKKKKKDLIVCLCFGPALCVCVCFCDCVCVFGALE